MHFALLGNHPDGLGMADALVASGRHRLLYHAGEGPAGAGRWPEARRVHDLEEVLADPAVEVVLVASGPANRPAHLRRAVQSERHAVCVHPADHAPEVAYEVGMIREDTRQAAVPLLPDAFHPGIVRLKEFLAPGRTPPGLFRLLEVERWATGEVIDPGAAGQGASFPGWDVLRALGGEIAEVSALTPDEE